MKFKLISDFKPTGDQPKAIVQLTENIEKKIKNQVILGVTGSGKTFTLANLIKNIQRPTLVISFHIMIIISLKHIFHNQIHTLRKKQR